MKITWTGPAAKDLDEIAAFVGREEAVAAIRLVLEIIRCVSEQLPAHPNSGRPGRVPGTRELVVIGTPFVVAYRVRQKAVQVLRVIHGRREWPDRL